MAYIYAMKDIGRMDKDSDDDCQLRINNDGSIINHLNLQMDY